MGLEKVAMEHFNNTQAFLSEEFYINICGNKHFPDFNRAVFLIKIPFKVLS